MHIIIRPIAALGRGIVRIVARVKHPERGASAVEYAIMASLIAAVIITAVAFLGRQTTSTFTCTGATLTAHTNQC